MQIEALKSEFDKLQYKFGNRTLRAIYGAGCVRKPQFCFVFMNPTGRNVSAHTNWKGLRAPWLGTKNVWKMFSELGLLSRDLRDLIQKMSPKEWDPVFSNQVYQEIADRGMYITNLSKSTQVDARHLPDSVFKQYLPLLHREVTLLKPKIIISFGNQVSSILLSRPVNVSRYRKKFVPLQIQNNIYPVYPVYYPVGQGMRNIHKAIRDIRWIISENKISILV